MNSKTTTQKIFIEFFSSNFKKILLYILSCLIVSTIYSYKQYSKDLTFFSTYDIYFNDRIKYTFAPIQAGIASDFSFFLKSKNINNYRIYTYDKSILFRFKIDQNLPDKKNKFTNKEFEILKEEYLNKILDLAGSIRKDYVDNFNYLTKVLLTVGYNKDLNTNKYPRFIQSHYFKLNQVDQFIDEVQNNFIYTYDNPEIYKSHNKRQVYTKNLFIAFLLSILFLFFYLWIKLFLIEHKKD